MSAEWQPIETAPKNGETIRLFFPYYVEGDQKHGRHAPGQREGFWAESIEGFGHWVTPGTMSTEDPEPTHWMPFPEPPQ